MVESLLPQTDHTDNQGGTRLVTAAPGEESVRQAVTTTTLRNLVLFANTNTIIIKLDVEVALWTDSLSIIMNVNHCSGF